MIVRQIKGTIFLLSIFFISMVAVNKIEDGEEKQQPVPIEHSADHFAIKYSKVQMNDQGFMKERLDADYAVHFSDNDETELVNPVMTFLQDNRPPWVMRAEKGIISAKGDKIFLPGTVYIDRAASGSVREVNVQTKNLHLEVKRSYAETDEWVEWVSEFDRMSGVGMRLFYQEPLYLELLADVKGKHSYE